MQKPTTTLQTKLFNMKHYDTTQVQMERKGDETNDCILIIVLNTHAQKPSHNTPPTYKEDCCITYIGVNKVLYKDYLNQCACY